MAQASVNDSIIVYDIKTQSTSIIFPATYNNTITFDKTPSSFGSLGNQIPLSLTPPTTNLFAGSTFSDLAWASSFFNVLNYPVRTAVKLFRYDNDTLKDCCSGIMVGENLVLTAAHCVRAMGSPSWIADSFMVAPVYDKGAFQTLLPTSKVEKCYIYKQFYDNKSIIRDLVLLQLSQPIGQQTGWVGMAFNADSAYFSNNVFHKLSYPGIVSPFDPTKIYNGDTLYYNYGNIYAPGPNHLGINSSSANGIPGQSGSSFFYTDNNTEYYSYGVMQLSTHCIHVRITNKIFYDFKNIIDNYVTGIETNEKSITQTHVFPNPFNQTAVISFSNPLNQTHSVVIYNSVGQMVKEITGISSDQTIIDRNDLSNGLYLFQLKTQNCVVGTGKFIID